MNLKVDLWAIAVLSALSAFVAWEAMRIGDLEVDRARLEAAAVANERSQRATGELEYRGRVQAAQEFVERPLFWASRRPPEIEEEAPPPPPPAPPPPPPRDLVVTGVVRLGDEWRVLIKRLRQQETVRLRQGDAIDGWVVKEVTPQRVTLGYGASAVELPLYDPPVAPQAVALPTPKADTRSTTAAPRVQSKQTAPAQRALPAGREPERQAAQTQ